MGFEIFSIIIGYSYSENDIRKNQIILQFKGNVLLIFFFNGTNIYLAKSMETKIIHKERRKRILNEILVTKLS